MTTARVELPDKIAPILNKPLGTYRYRGLWGGRGSGKSRSFAIMAAVFGFIEPLRVLCTREYQSSIRESFYAELKSAIESLPWLAAHYEIGAEYIRGNNGSEFFFRGLRNQIGAIKSLANIDLTIVEEAEDVPEDSWLALEATVFRRPKSEIWVAWNPRLEGSPVDLRMRKNPPPKSAIAQVNFYDNPFFPAALDDLRKREQTRLDAGMYAWIWEGSYNTKSDAQVLNGKWRIDVFEPNETFGTPYFGADWGFAEDPTTLIKCFVKDDKLYISHELYIKKLEISDTAQAFRSIPDADRYTIRADSARPETISHVARAGLRVVPVKKGKGSVEDGIAFLRSFREIIIHPRCQHTINEARTYSYKQDVYTKDVLPDIIDANNHCIDALRYALEPLMIGNKSGVFLL